ncbi:hypothetical protein L596_006977 [Steinernema carpocapsae]|uniref:tRNA/rRNA methyltransferase SpoU type domain-containing protein n=1 Tax=Steinernema carpocapsae TaxID=34508 RepID=A0A4U5P8U8_STECR|nr:hypothetical protein L596_006977 [Steinernema carpocapsae]
MEHESEFGQLYDAGLGGGPSQLRKEESDWTEEVDAWVARFTSDVEEAKSAICEALQGERGAEPLAPLVPVLVEKIPSASKALRSICLLRLLGNPDSRVARKAGGETLMILAEKEGCKEKRIRWWKYAELMNMLEEPQFHLINPVLGIFDWLVEECVKEAARTGGDSDPDELGWNYGQLAFAKAMNHTNGWIRSWTIEKAVKLPTILFRKDYDFIFTQLMPALNGIDTFWRLVEKSVLKDFLNDLHEFFQNITEDILWQGSERTPRDEVEDEFYQRLLASLTDNWTPLPLFFLSATLATLKPYHYDAYKTSDCPTIRNVISAVMKIQQIPLKQQTLANLMSFFIRTVKWGELSELREFLRPITKPTIMWRTCQDALKETFTDYLSLEAEFPYKEEKENEEEEIAICGQRVGAALTVLDSAPTNGDSPDTQKGTCRRCVDQMSLEPEWSSVELLFFIVTQTINREIPEIAEQIEILDILERVACEFQKSTHYVPAIRMFFGVLFESNACNSERAIEKFMTFMEKASLNTSIAAMLATLVEKHYEKLSVDWVTPVVEMAKFGPIPKHEAKVMEAAFEMVFSDPFMGFAFPSFFDQIHRSSKLCRATGILVAQKMCKNKGAEFQQKFVDEAVRFANEADESSSRSYGLSMAHRVKTRIGQLMILLDLEKADQKDIYDYLMGCFLDSCQQYSVTLIAEWMLVRMCLRDKGIYETFLNSAGPMAKKRIGSVASWINVLMHVARIDRTEEGVGTFFKAVFPWVSAQNFAIRCSAIASLKVVYGEFFGQDWCQDNFGYIEALISFDLEPAGNTKRVVQDLVSDFYFGYLQANEDLCLEAVLKVLPAKTGMPADELIEKEVFQLLGESLKYQLDNLYMRDGRSVVYSGLAKSSCSAPEMLSDSQLSKEFVDRDMFSMQRKINVKNGREVEKLDDNKSLIVIASLIDKAQNLGGLARTSEIFGVKKLVVANSDITKNQDFKALSMSAENWLPLEQSTCAVVPGRELSLQPTVQYADADRNGFRYVHPDIV